MTENYYYRKINQQDIPSIKSMCSQIWDGDDYIPYVIDVWIEQKNSYILGVFSDEKRSNLIGFSRLRCLWNDEKNTTIWIEGGRISPESQRKGVGLKLTNKILDVIKNYGGNFAQYDAWSENIGSITIAQKFDFYEKTRMDILECNDAKLLDCKFQNKKYHRITPKDALILFDTIKNPPKDTINVGWSYIPKNLNLFDNPNYTIFTDSEAQSVVLFFDSNSTLTHETPKGDNFWLVVFGDKNFAEELVKRVIFFEMIEKKQKIGRINIFCPPAISQNFFHPSFSYIEGKKSSVILFEKEINQ